MLEEINKAIVRQWNKAADSGNFAVADELFSADFVDHANLHGAAADREDFKQSIARLRATFADPHYAARHVIAEDDLVVVHALWYDAAARSLPPDKPHGEQVALREMAVYCIIDGMIVERWSALERAALPQQLDALLFTQEVGS